MIVPLLHGVIIKPDHVEKKTDGGIIIPDMVTDKERKAVEYGTVVRVGPRAYMDYGRSPDILQKGDRVTFARYAGKEVRDTDDEVYLMVNDIDILGIIMETDNG
jgi:co-chaperonin GroES (HSP10)